MKGKGKNMFDKFGEFDSWEEINRAAAAQLAEGDEEAILAIAGENGLDTEDAEDFIDGVVPELCNPLMAAYGKLKMEEAGITAYGITKDWMTYIRIRCQEEEKMALAVRRKEKHLEECLGALLKWSLENAKPVDRGILKAAGIPNQYWDRTKLGIPDMGKAKEIITEYYLGGQS